jgi:hypothetical protein
MSDPRIDVASNGVDLEAHAPLVQAIRQAAHAFTRLSVDRINQESNARRSRLLAEFEKRPTDKSYTERLGSSDEMDHATAV